MAEDKKESTLFKYILAPIIVAIVTAAVVPYFKGCTDSPQARNSTQNTPSNRGIAPNTEVRNTTENQQGRDQTSSAGPAESPRRRNNCLQSEPWQAELSLDGNQPTLLKVMFTGSALLLQTPYDAGRPTSFSTGFHFYYACTSDGDYIHLGPQLLRNAPGVTNFPLRFLPHVLQRQDDGSFAGVLKPEDNPNFTGPQSDYPVTLRPITQ